MTIQFAAPKRPKAEGYGAKMGSDWFRLAAGPDHPVAITTRDSLAERFDQKASAFENVLDVGYAFSRNNLTGGEGLDWYPRISQTGQVLDIDAIRFWDSANINIDPPDRGQKYRASLTRQTQIFWTPPNPPVDMSESEQFIYVAHGDTLTWFDGWNDNTVIPGQEFEFTGLTIVKVEAVASNEVYVLTDDGHLWYKPFDEPTDFVDVYDLSEPSPDNIPLSNIWALKNRVLAERTADPGTGLDGTVELVEGNVTNIGTPGVPDWALTFTTLDTGGARFRDCIDAGTAILAAVGDGSIRSYVPQSDTAGATPELTIRGTYPTPSGEEPFTLGYTAGVVVFLTISEEEGLGTQTCRAYSGRVQSEQLDYVTGDVQMFRIWRGTTETVSITKRMLSDRNRIFWSMEEEGFVDNLWLYDVITTGTMRSNTLGIDVSSGVLFNEIFGARGTVTNDILYTGPTYQPSGYLISPNVNFGLNTPINWISVVLEGENIQVAGDQLELWGAVDPGAIEDPNSPAWFLLTAITNPSQAGLEIPIINLQSKSLALQVKFFSTKGGTESPILTRFSVRGFPAHRDFIVDVPINVSDTVSAPGRMPYRIPGLGNVLHERVLSYSGKSIRLTVLDPPIMIDGVVDQIAEPTEYISHRGSVSRYCQVRIRGTKVDGTSVGSNQGLGIGLLGVSILGIDKVTESL